MNFRRWALSFVFCILVFASLAAFKVFEIKAAIAFGQSFPEHSETVEVSTITKVKYAPSIKVIGEVLAPQYLDVRNELLGKIVSVNFESGEHVEKNQVLIQLDISIEKANLEAANARSELAQSIYERARNLKNSKAISQEQLDRAKADLATSRAEIEVLKNTIEKKTILAPFSGRTGIHQLEVGQYILDNTSIITLVGDKNYQWIDFKVPQFYPALSNGDKVEVKAISQQKPKEVFSAFVIAEDTAINNKSRSRLYRAKLEGGLHVFTHRSSVDVQVPVKEVTSFFSVPITSVQNDNLGQFIFLLNKVSETDNETDGFRAKRQRVSVDEHYGQSALISRGLTVGDRVAAAGSFKLREGMLVYANERPKLIKESQSTDTLSQDQDQDQDQNQDQEPK